MTDDPAATPEQEALTFFSRAQFATIDALAGRIIPGSATDPGAREAAAAVYVDRALAGKYAELQPLYRIGIAALDAHCQDRHGASFAQLDSERQDAVLVEINDIDVEAPTVSADTRRGADELDYFFNVVREHVIQGTFCDPVHGGNRDGVGWKLVGFPGAYWSYEEWQGEADLDAATLPLRTLADIPAQERAWRAAREEAR